MNLWMSAARATRINSANSNRVQGRRQGPTNAGAILRRVSAARWRIALGLVLAGGLSPGLAGAQPPEPIRFSRDVAPIVARHCMPCHADDGAAPFALTTAGAVQARAATIAEVVTRRYMPPWKPDPGFGDFEGPGRLPDVALDRIAAWVRAGARLDVPVTAAVSPAARGDADPPPDLVVQLPTYQLRPDGPDVFRNFVVPVPIAGPRYVRGLVFRPRSAAVHHANIRIDPTRASRLLDEADADAGYEGIILRSADFPDGHFLGWTPGQIAPGVSDAVSWRLEANVDLVVQLHLRPTGRTEPVAPAIGLYFTDRPPSHRPVMLRLGRQTLAVPAGAAAFDVEDAFVLPVDVEVHAVQPHAHFRAREVEATALLPDGTRRPLLRIGDWDARWQDRYRYRTPLRLPAGTRVVARFRYDNSATNPRNPVQPPVLAEWGWRTSDEMGDVWLQLVTASDGERERLAGETRLKMQTEDALGCEQLLRREPQHVALRNDAAVIYMSLGRPADALRHFEVVTALEPASAAAWFNEGVALEALGRPREAADRYRAAITRRSGYSAAHNNLGAVLLREGRMDEARASLERAVETDPANLEARANLATVLIGSGEADAALDQVQQLLRQPPDFVARLTPLAWLLAAHPSAAIRRPDAARELAMRVVAASHRRDPAALDALAAALAAGGRFDEAVRVATEALAIAGPSDAEAIRARVTLYQQRQPFVLTR